MPQQRRNRYMTEIDLTQEQKDLIIKKVWATAFKNISEG